MITKEEFKRRWELNDSGDGLTYDDCAACAINWGLTPHPRIMKPDDVVELVLRAAGCRA